MTVFYTSFLLSLRHDIYSQRSMPFYSSQCGRAHSFPYLIEAYFFIVNAFPVAVPPATAICICYHKLGTKITKQQYNLTHLNLKRQNIKGEKLCFTEKHEKITSDSRYSILTVIINRSCFLLAYKTLIPSSFLVGLWFWFWITSKHCEMFSYSVFATAAYLKEKSGLVGQI